MNNKYNPGDKVTVEVTIKYHNPGKDWLKGADSRGYLVDVCITDIIKHEPKPWEPEIGAIIKVKDTGSLYKVLGVFEGMVWVKTDYPGSFPYTCKLSQFEQVSQ